MASISDILGTIQQGVTAANNLVKQMTGSLNNISGQLASFVVGPSSATSNGFAVYNGTTGKLIKDHAATINLTSEVANTLPVANGGTGDTGTAWTTYTPTITASTGTFTTVSATGRFKTLGKTVFIEINITVTAIGTASVAMAATLPAGITAAAATYPISGTEAALTGKAVKGVILSGATSLTNMSYYDNTFPGASGNFIALTGVFETA